MVVEESHYDVLGIPKDASQGEVKRAFYRLLPKYPPEQKPEEYKKIREAYDVLSNPVSRREYDNMAAFGDEIEQLREQAEALLKQDSPDVEAAIRKLKRAVVLGPDIGILRNQLGLCFMRSEDYSQALRQFEKATEIDEKNESYWMNRGLACKELGKTQEAETIFRGVWDSNREDYEAPRALAKLLFHDDRRQEAFEVLEEAIMADGKVDFQDFFCYYDKLYFHLLEGDTDALEEDLETVVSIAKNPADKEFAAFMLARNGFELYQLNAFSLAKRFADAALELNAEDPDLQILNGVLEDLGGLEEGVKEITESEDIHDFIKHLVGVSYAQWIGELDAQEVNKSLEGLDQAVDNLMRIDPDNKEIKSSLRRIKNRYPEVYELQEELFDLLLSLPSARLVASPCPHCSETITGEKGIASRGRCPHCHGEIRFDGEKIKARRSSRSRSTSSGSRSKSRSGGTSSKSRSTSSQASTASTNESKDSGCLWLLIITAILYFLAMLGG